jgi:hypothetical protein
VAQGVKIVELRRIGESIREQRLMAVDLATDGFRVRIKQELGRIASMTSSGVVRTVDAVPVALTRLNTWKIGVPDVAVDLNQLDAGFFTLIADEAQLHFGCNF